MYYHMSAFIGTELTPVAICISWVFSERLLALKMGISILVCLN